MILIWKKTKIKKTVFPRKNFSGKVHFPDLYGNLVSKVSPGCTEHRIPPGLHWGLWDVLDSDLPLLLLVVPEHPSVEVSFCRSPLAG